MHPALPLPDTHHLPVLHMPPASMSLRSGPHPLACTLSQPGAGRFDLLSPETLKVQAITPPHFGLVKVGREVHEELVC